MELSAAEWKPLSIAQIHRAKHLTTVEWVFDMQFWNSIDIQIHSILINESSQIPLPSARRAKTL